MNPKPYYTWETIHGVTKLQPGDIVLLVDITRHLENKAYPVHFDSSGLYKAYRGHMRYIALAVIGYANDYAVYEGYTSIQMSDDDRVEVISQSGDKVSRSTAEYLTRDIEHLLSKLSYRS